MGMQDKIFCFFPPESGSHKWGSVHKLKWCHLCIHRKYSQVHQVCKIQGNTQKQSWSSALNKLNSWNLKTKKTRRPNLTKWSFYKNVHQLAKFMTKLK
jgi:hypothetical protein